MKNNTNMLFLTYDGDNAGRLVGRAILADDVGGLHEVSNRINAGHEVVKGWVEEHGGQIISGGGDEGSFIIPPQAMEDVERLRADYQYTTDLTMTVGVGSSLSEAGKSLMVGKFRGKDQVVIYDESVEPDLVAAKEHMEAGTATQEEKKIGEAYLKNEDGTDMNNQGELQGNQEVIAQSELADCQYCKPDAEQAPAEDHCQYCHDLEQPEEAHCQYCAEADAKEDHEHSGDDCEYCAAADAGQSDVEQTAGPDVTNPTTTDSENFEGQDLNPPNIGKPDPSKEAPIGLGTSMEAPQTNNNVAINQGENNGEEEAGQKGQEASKQNQETMAVISQALEGNPQQNQVNDIVAQLDAEQLAVGSNMVDNVSRPEDYDSNAPGDLGLSEEDEAIDPDLTDVLQGGLDNHADSIQREKVIQMVSQALEGFKASKNILETAKDQAPQLYQSSIAMLKAMIEMAKMLGLNSEPKEEGSEEQLQEEVPQEQSQGSMNNFNFHQNSAGNEAAAQDPKPLGQ